MKRHYIPVTADIPGVGDERKAFVRKVIRTALAAEGVDTFLECGPGKTLCGLIKKTVKTARVFQVQDGETLDAALSGLM